MKTVYNRWKIDVNRCNRCKNEGDVTRWCCKTMHAINYVKKWSVVLCCKIVNKFKWFESIDDVIWKTRYVKIECIGAKLVGTNFEMMAKDTNHFDGKRYIFFDGKRYKSFWNLKFCCWKSDFDDRKKILKFWCGNEYEEQYGWNASMKNCNVCGSKFVF